MIVKAISIVNEICSYKQLQDLAKLTNSIAIKQNGNIIVKCDMEINKHVLKQQLVELIKCKITNIYLTYAEK